MKITTNKKTNRIQIKLKQMPNELELNELNGLRKGDVFRVCSSRGYDRLLQTTKGKDIISCTMECPINQTFIL